jgi:hypothetical protein
MSRASRLLLIDTLGGSAPEFITAALSTRTEVNALPGLAFVRDDLRLYRRHRLDGLDAGAVFDRLWQPSYEPGGRLWAGVLRQIPPAERSTADLARARSLFQHAYRPEAGYLAALETFASAVLRGFGWWKEDATWLAACGVPFLKTVSWTELADSKCVVVESAVPVDTWLALISYRSVVRCPNALIYWLIHKLLYRLAARQGVRIVRCDALLAGRRGALERDLLRELDLDTGQPDAARPAPGHMTFNAAIFAHTERLAGEIAAIYGDTLLYRRAVEVDSWARTALEDEELVRLLTLYLRYWDTTAHVHFDTSGPCEQAIAARLDTLLGERAMGAPPVSATPQWSYDFYERLVDFHSYDFETPTLRVHTSLGALEAQITLPRAPYFLHAALCYLERCVNIQGKWFDSYQSVAASHLYQRLKSQEYAMAIEQFGYAERLQQLAGRDAEIRERAAGRLHQ